jgi:DUF971 family protein
MTLEFAAISYHKYDILVTISRFSTCPPSKAGGRVNQGRKSMRKNTVRPTDIKLHQKSRLLEVAFDDGSHFKLPCEYLRAYSPSAEVRGHAPGQEVLQVGKENVNITNIEPVGSYAVCLFFDDGHSTGIYSWDWLHHLGTDQDSLWKQYLERLAKAGVIRKPVKPAE